MAGRLQFLAAGQPASAPPAPSHAPRCKFQPAGPCLPSYEAASAAPLGRWAAEFGTAHLAMPGPATHTANPRPQPWAALFPWQPAAPAFSRPAAASTVQGVMESCWPRQAPWLTLMTKTAGEASALQSSKSTRLLGARPFCDRWEIHSVRRQHLQAVYASSKQQRAHTAAPPLAVLQPRLILRYCSAGPKASAGVPMAAKKLPPQVSSEPQATHP